MKPWLPVLIGFIAGIVAGVVFLPLGGMALAQDYHTQIRDALYPNTDPMAGLVFDPLIIVVCFGLVGLAIGLVWVVVHRLVGPSSHGHSS